MQYFNQTNILWHALTIFLLIGALTGIALALLLIFKPHLIERVNSVANHWISTDHIEQLMDRSIFVERWCYRHHRLLGLVVILGASYILVYFGLQFDKTTALRSMTANVRDKYLIAMLLEAMVLMALIGAVFSLVTGLFLLLRPSLLRGVEKVANQWVSSRRATKLMDIPHEQVNRFVALHAQRVGWLLLMGSIYLFFVMFRWLV